MARSDALDDLSFEVESVPVEDLSPHPKNYRSHPDEQMQEIRASVREFGIYKNIVAAEDYTILAGHGVVRAAEMEGYESVPVYRFQIGPEDPMAYKLMAADNELSRLAIDDKEDLAYLLSTVEESDATDIRGTGFNKYDLDALLDDARQPPDPAENGERDGEGESRYTDKIDTPTYEPSGEQPPVEELFDSERTEELLQSIEKADLPDDLERFLKLAAYRHTEFDFEKIADYYADADSNVQRLMEDSALVIVDFGKAIGDGFVQLTQRVRETLIDHPEFSDEG